MSDLNNDYKHKNHKKEKIVDFNAKFKEEQKNIKEKKELKEEKLSEKLIEELKEEIQEEVIEEKSENEKLKEEIKELNEKILRIHADFSNYKTRNNQLQLQIYSEKEERFLKDFLLVLDTIDRAISAYKDEKILEGYNKIKKQFIEVLEKYNVKEMETDGKEFDPVLHEAVSQLERNDVKENIILHTTLKGYKINNKVLRHAQVIVSVNNKE